MSPNFYSHLLTGSCFSKLQAAGGLRANRLLHLLELACTGDHKLHPHLSPFSCKFAQRLNITFSVHKVSSFYNFLFFLSNRENHLLGGQRLPSSFFFPPKFFKNVWRCPHSLPCPLLSGYSRQVSPSPPLQLSSPLGCLP